MFTVTTNPFGHKEAVFKSPAIKGSTRLKDTVEVIPSYNRGGSLQKKHGYFGPDLGGPDENGNITEPISYTYHYKGSRVTFDNGLSASIGEGGGGSGASVGTGPHDSPTEDGAFNKTLHTAAKLIARHHSHVNQILTNTKEDLDATHAKSEAFQENRIGKPCSFCGEKIDSAYDSFNGHQIMANGWCQNAFNAVYGGGHWGDDVPEHETGE